MGLPSLLIVVLGLVFILVGLGIGIIEGHPLGGMVGLLLGIGLFGVAFIFKDDD
jgi:hypothetical protein